MEEKSPDAVILEAVGRNVDITVIGAKGVLVEEGDGSNHDAD
jgi:hypothetical protein